MKLGSRFLITESERLQVNKFLAIDKVGDSEIQQECVADHNRPVLVNRLQGQLRNFLTANKKISNVAI